VWLEVSDGFTNGSLEAAPLQELVSKLDLAHRGLELSAQGADSFYERLLEAVPRARFLRDDATLVVVCADPNTRFESGIESH
jgi:hypothetical protein